MKPATLVLLTGGGGFEAPRYASVDRTFGGSRVVESPRTVAAPSGEE